MFFYFISSADLISILFHLIPLFSILLYLKLIRFDLILFYFILLNLIYYIVQYCISYEWMICVYLSVRLSVCVFICMNKFIVYSFFVFFFLFLFSFFLFSLYSFFTLFSYERLPHTYTHTLTRTHKCIWIYFPSYDSYILLQKPVSEESYSSDSIMSYLI